MYNNLFQLGENENFAHNIEHDLQIKSDLSQKLKEGLKLQ
jgi:hypothetical protein